MHHLSNFHFFAFLALMPSTGRCPEKDITVLDAAVRNGWEMR
jgi:hypothetical protein